MTRDEKILRQLVAVGHGEGVYWDDGEMSEGNWPFIDFLRDSPETIQSKITQRKLKKMAGLRYVDGVWSEP